MRYFALLAFAAACAPLVAQQPMGTVATSDAKISGALEVHSGRATLVSNDSITALDHAASIQLARGGEALVCATSEFHLLHSGAGQALLFGLDRGAVELRGSTQSQDVILTPDIRFSVEHPGQLDLRLRVTRDGDTCVDNHGLHAPVLLLNDSFTGGSYRVLPGQHVLFEHGDLRRVVDHERSDCGCPSAEPSSAQLAANATPAQRTAAEHPFPTATSEGLTAQPDTLPPPAKPGVQGTVDFRVNTGGGAPIPIAPESDTLAPQPPHGVFHAIGHFFKWLFGDSAQPQQPQATPSQ
jgi:hypothetical protein